MEAAHKERVDKLLATDVGDRLIYGRTAPGAELKPYERAANEAAKVLLAENAALIRFEGTKLRVGELQTAARLAINSNYAFNHSAGSRAAGAAAVAGDRRRESIAAELPSN